MSGMRVAFAGMACLVTMPVLSAPPMLAGVSTAKAHVPPSPSTSDAEPCLVGTPKCTDIGTPPKACLVGGTNANTCPTDAKVIAISK